MRHLSLWLSLPPLLAISVCAQTIPVLSQAQIQQLETTVAQNPADGQSQTLLGQNYALVILGITSLGQYDRVTSLDPAEAQGAFAQHARDVMQNSAFAGVLGEGGKALWNFSFQVQGFAKPDTPIAYLDARTLGVQALDHAIQLDPGNANWRSYRIPILVLRSELDFMPLRATDAYNEVKGDLVVLTGSTRYYMLASAGKLAVKASVLDDAQSYASELLNSATDPTNWNYGNAIFFGNMILGQVALRRGNLETAKGQLLAAGKTPGSPQLNSFGPNMSLAKELLTGVAEVPNSRRAPQHHAVSPDVQQTVLQFFGLCQTFWTMGMDKLQQWSQQVQDGLVPNFGANLFY